MEILNQNDREENQTKQFQNFFQIKKNARIFVQKDEFFIGKKLEFLEWEEDQTLQRRRLKTGPERSLKSSSIPRSWVETRFPSETINKISSSHFEQQCRGIILRTRIFICSMNSFICRSESLRATLFASSDNSSKPGRNGGRLGVGIEERGWRQQ